MYYIYTDGASRGNPGPSSYGIYIVDSEGEKVYSSSGFLGKHTNNYAEYMGVIEGMTKAIHFGFENITILTDSKLIVNQVTNKWDVMAKSLKPLCRNVKELSRRVRSFNIKWIPRERNKRADELCNEALKKYLSEKD